MAMFGTKSKGARLLDAIAADQRGMRGVMTVVEAEAVRRRAFPSATT
jgi:hypothetical protein